MRRYFVSGAMIMVGGLLGCDSTHPVPPAEQSQVNSQMLVALRDEAIRNAILTQHTLFPYHFETNSAELNELGRQDLTVLAEYAQRHSGKLTVKQGNAPDELYRERLQAVMRMLADSGVKTDRVTLVDGTPGGEGMPAGTVRQIIEGRNSPSDPVYYDDTGGSSSGSNIFGGGGGGGQR